MIPNDGKIISDANKSVYKNPTKYFGELNSIQYNLNNKQKKFYLNNSQQNIPLNGSSNYYSQDIKYLPEHKVSDVLGNFKSSDVFLFQEISLNQKVLTREYILTSFNDQKATILLQRIVMGAQKETIEYILKELKGIFRKIIKDKNGNYFCNDLIKACTQEQRIQILEELSSYISEDCSNNFSTHPIQTLIDRASSEAEYNLILYSFNDYNKFLFAALDPTGSYTVQKIIERIPERYRKQFNIILASFIGFLSKKQFGIVVTKKFISFTKNDEITALILNLVKNNFMDFAEDQFANYLIQFLFEKWKETPDGNEIKKLIRENFIMMCEKKYSSFICEIFIKYITQEEKNGLIKDIDIDEANKSNNPHFIKIMKILGIYTNQNKKRDDYNNSQLPLNSINNFLINNNISQKFTSSFNFANNNNFENNNNINTIMNNDILNNNNNIHYKSNYSYKQNKKN